ncbi:GntR family transcriptional regulator [Cytobacillus firmus]|uniref:GntR family transcriptional regulator n=1 Tax=Cytobacillus firmus TaxID=1399 RepID=UPI0024C1E763|nr:GntR family transcriptional regulator [Cytobacillus firmus]WHY59671.1 GntR family transcriptional regulator [Cytobacillus firmus]
MKKDNKQEIAYKFIRSRILEGTYVQGQRLVFDTIGKELSLSPIPIREAIRRLEAEGLVTIKAYSGAVVSTINETEYYEVLSTLAILEGYAVSLSKAHVSDEQLKILHEINNSISEALKQFDFNGYIQLNKEFHLQTIKNCPNKSLYTMIKHMWEKLDAIRRLKPMYFPVRAIEAISEHETIISYLQNSVTGEEIERFVRKHHMAALKDNEAKK